MAQGEITVDGDDGDNDSQDDDNDDDDDDLCGWHPVR